MSVQPPDLLTLHLLALDELRLDRDQLAAELRRVSGLALRRSGPMAALALLACLRATQGMAPAAPSAPPTLVIWHSCALVAEETTALMRAMTEDEQGVMPFNFLASQPALLGLTLQPHLGAELVDAIYLPWADEQGTDAWPRSLQLAALWLREGRCARVLCLRLDRADGHFRAQTMTLGRPGPQGTGIVRLHLGASTAGAPPSAELSRDLFSLLHDRLRDGALAGPLALHTPELHVSVESGV